MIATVLGVLSCSHNAAWQYLLVKCVEQRNIISLVKICHCEQANIDSRLPL